MSLEDLVELVTSYARPCYTFEFRYDRQRNEVVLSPLFPEVYDWLESNQDFVRATLDVIKAEFDGQRVRVSGPCPVLRAAANRTREILQAAYPNVEIAMCLTSLIGGR